MDNIERLVFESQFTAVILGNPQTFDYELIEPVPVSPETQANLSARGMCFIGCVGLVGGQFRTALSVPIDDRAITFLTQAFVGFLSAKLQLSTKTDGDAVAWLRNLYQLQDRRTTN